MRPDSDGASCRYVARLWPRRRVVEQDEKVDQRRPPSAPFSSIPASAAASLAKSRSASKAARVVGHDSAAGSETCAIVFTGGPSSLGRSEKRSSIVDMTTAASSRRPLGAQRWVRLEGGPPTIPARDHPITIAQRNLGAICRGSWAICRGTLAGAPDTLTDVGRLLIHGNVRLGGSA